MKKKLNKFNDGIVSIYREKRKRNNFSAKENVEALDDMDFVAKLAFQEMYKREQDITFAEANGFSLSLKIKTRLLKSVDNGCKAIIDGYLYDVKSTDKNRTELYLYLEGVGEIDS